MQDESSSGALTSQAAKEGARKMETRNLNLWSWGGLKVDSEYEIVGVMRSKYIFKTRPKPINNAKAMMKKKAKKP